MLRVGLTGDLGSGKSTVARLLAAHGAVILSSDEMGRALMQPGQRVFEAIVARFGPEIIASDGTLDRRALARLAFDPAQPRVDELNAIVHPAVIDEQLRRIEELARTDPHAIVVVESALIFTTPHMPGGLTWRERFDVIVLVTAPEAVKIARFMERMAAGRELPEEERTALEADARRRLELQRIAEELARQCLVVSNDDSLEALAMRVDQLWIELQALAIGAAGAPGRPQ